jgi:hypothetical protein
MARGRHHAQDSAAAGAPDRIDLMRVLRADPSAAAMVWLRGPAGRRVVRRASPPPILPNPTGPSSRVEPPADVRAELARARRETRISSGQLCQLPGIDQQRHMPAGPLGPGWLWGLRRVPAGSRAPSRAFQGHRRLRLQLTILARRIVPRLSVDAGDEAGGQVQRVVLAAIQREVGGVVHVERDVGVERTPWMWRPSVSAEPSARGQISSTDLWRSARRRPSRALPGCSRCAARCAGQRPR